MERRFWGCILLVIIACCVAHAAAHVPMIPAGGSGVTGAVIVPDSAKSYAWYGTIGEPGRMEYYRLEFVQGDNMVFSLSATDPGYLPVLYLLIPSNKTGEVVPAGIDVPPGYEVTGVPGAIPFQASYEPFSPMAMYEISSLEGPAPVSGVYYAVVSAPEPGRYILATGYLEEFTPAEWLGIPVELVRVRLGRTVAVPAFRPLPNWFPADGASGDAKGKKCMEGFQRIPLVRDDRRGPDGR